MSRIDELIQQLCPEGVKYYNLPEICRKITTGKLNANAMVEGGEYPFFTCDEKQFKIDEYAFDEEAILVSGNGSQVGHVNYYKGKFNAYQRTYVLYGFTENVNIRYILYYSKSYLRGYIFKFSKKGSVPYITLPILQNFSIPIPPLEIQNEIVQTLDLFTTLEAELEAELEARKTQCTYYRDSLLSLEGNDVEWKTLGEIYEFKYGTGNTIPTVGGAFPVYGSNGIVGTHNEYNSEDAPVIGHIGAYAGIVNWAPGKHFVTYNGVICRLKDSTVHPRYAYHQLLVQDFRSKANSGSQPFVSYSMLNKVEVPLPSFKEQEIIADVLDKFDALVNDISIGLPAEIEGRRKQYEYYRNRLLTFKELGNG